MDENNPKAKLQQTLLKIAVILGFLALLAMVAIPNFVSTGNRQGRQRNYCINNLRQIDAAKQQWAMENNKTNLETVVTWDAVTLYLGRGPQGSLTSIYCPEDKTKTASNSYTLGNLGSLPKCKINPVNHFIN